MRDMNAKESIIGFHIELFFDTAKEDEEIDNGVFSLIENLKLGVLKSLVFEIDSNRIIFKILKKMPLLTMESEKYDFAVNITQKSINVSHPKIVIPPSLVEEGEEEEESEFKIETIKHIDKTLTSIISALSAKIEKPLKIKKSVIGVVFKIDPETLKKLVGDIVDVRLNTEYNIDIANLRIKASKESVGIKYTFIIRKSTFIIEKEYSCDVTVNLMQQFEEVVSEAELFIKEKKLNVKQ